jgi:competence protein ComEA
MRMPQISRARAIAYAIAILLVLVLGGRFALGGAASPSRDSDRPADASSESASLRQASDPPLRILLVHVVGAVHRPGLYRLRDGSRVADAVERAGGAKPKAALELVNLAAPVADGQQVLVPRRGEAVSTAGLTPGAAGPPGVPAQKVHLNSATLEELDTLPGVGPVTAQKILDYRTEHGAFQTVEELDAVPGIGPTRLAELTPLVDL